MAQTVNFGLVNLETNQYNPEVTYNQNLEKLDVLIQICANSISNTPPAGTNGLVVIVGTSPTGAFTTHNNKIAYYYNGWKFIIPVVGWIATISTTLALVMWNGSSWDTPSLSSNFSDAAFYVNKVSDATAKVKFNLTNVPTSTTADISLKQSVVLAKQNFSATSNPTSSDDSYDISSIWVNTSTNDIFVCVNNTSGNAIWKQMAGATGSGDVLGPVSSIDNEIVIFNGTTGENIQGSGIIITDNKQLYKHFLYLENKTIAYTITGADSGKFIIVNSSSNLNITLPQTTTETINEGFYCKIIRRGSGTVTLVTQGSDTIESKNSYVSISPRYGEITVVKIVNGTPNTWYLSGDLA
jgi:hypothetical protein